MSDQKTRRRASAPKLRKKHLDALGRRYQWLGKRLAERSTGRSFDVAEHVALWWVLSLIATDEELEKLGVRRMIERNPEQNRGDDSEDDGSDGGDGAGPGPWSA